jgi:RNA polymerase sigma-70 factor, ECF subfamily
MVECYIDAWERRDVEALAALLAEDATFAMPPYPRWWRGRHVIAAFAAESRHRYLPARANAQLANAAYRWDPERALYAAEALEVLTLEAEQIKEMTAFMTSHLFARFGLPETLPP